MEDADHGLVDHWLAGIRDSLHRHRDELSVYADEQARFDRLVELNVLRQVFNLRATPIVQNAWKRGRRPILHGMVYDLKDGLLRELVLGVDGPDKVRMLLETDQRGVGV